MRASKREVNAGLAQLAPCNGPEDAEAVRTSMRSNLVCGNMNESSAKFVASRPRSHRMIKVGSTFSARAWVYPGSALVDVGTLPNFAGGATYTSSAHSTRSRCNPSSSTHSSSSRHLACCRAPPSSESNDPACEDTNGSVRTIKKLPYVESATENDR